MNPWEMEWSGVTVKSVGDTKTTSADMKMLTEASNEAAKARDSARNFSRAEKAVKDFGTGPVKSWIMDAITAEDGGGVLDSVGAIVGAPVRALIPQRTKNAYDQLRTVSAGSALAGSEQLKGAASDADMRLLKTRGLSPYKSEAENLRIIEEAKRDAGLAQTRASFKSHWISRYGSVANPDRNGRTFEQGAADAERLYEKYLKEGRPERNRGLSTPPHVKTAKQEALYDLDGNLIE